MALAFVAFNRVEGSMPPKRILYGCAGPANLIRSHSYWRDGVSDPTEVSLTFSGQISDFVTDIQAQAYFISVHPEKALEENGDFIIEHRPKRSASGIGYYLEELRYGLRLLATARRWKADVAILDSGITLYAVVALFSLFGISVIVVLHNTLWPSGHRPVGLVPRLLNFSERRFWQRGPCAVIGVSPECTRQVEEVSPLHSYPIYEIRAQFLPERFAAIPPPPPHDHRPFRVMFIGRVERLKGVLDIPIMARWIEDRAPGMVTWEICGRGSELEGLRELVDQLQLADIVFVRGWTTIEEVQEVYARSHAAIVPTRSIFAEGLAMTAAEAILAGRPLISNPVVPALELLAPAAVAGITDDPISHAKATLELASNSLLFEGLCRACPLLAKQFYDYRLGLRNVLHAALKTSLSVDVTPVAPENLCA